MCFQYPHKSATNYTSNGEKIRRMPTTLVPLSLRIKKQFAAHTQGTRVTKGRQKKGHKKLATKDANDLFNRFDHEHMFGLKTAACEKWPKIPGHTRDILLNFISFRPFFAPILCPSRPLRKRVKCPADLFNSFGYAMLTRVPGQERVRSIYDERGRSALRVNNVKRLSICVIWKVRTGLTAAHGHESLTPINVSRGRDRRVSKMCICDDYSRILLGILIGYLTYSGPPG